MIKNLLSLMLLVSFFITQESFGFSTPEALAHNAALEAASQVFSSPALPSLDNDGTSVTPLYGIVTINPIDEDVTSDDGTSYTITRQGQFKGQIAGLTASWTHGDLGLFSTAAWSKVSGDMTTTDKYTTSDVRDAKAQTYIGIIGLSYRFIGDAKSTFAMGIFGGPAWLKSNSSANIVQTDGRTTTVIMNPQMQALYLGLQMMFRFGEFRINPFMNLFGNTSSQCEKPTYEGDDYPIAQYQKCRNGDHGIDADSFMAGAGINIGYGRLGFGLVKTATGMDMGLKSSPLMISFRIGL